MAGIIKIGCGVTLGWLMVQLLGMVIMFASCAMCFMQCDRHFSPPPSTVDDATPAKTEAVKTAPAKPAKTAPARPADKEIGLP